MIEPPGEDCASVADLGLSLIFGYVSAPLRPWRRSITEPQWKNVSSGGILESVSTAAVAAGVVLARC